VTPAHGPRATGRERAGEQHGLRRAAQGSPRSAPRSARRRPAIAPGARSGGEGVVGGQLLGGALADAGTPQADHAGVSRLAGEQRLDRRVASPAAGPGLARASNVLDRSRPALDAFTDGAIANPLAVTDEQASLDFE
jgi:hypothetical protein